MEQDWFKRVFVDNGINVAIPNEKERVLIDKIISEELEFGIVNESSREKINSIIQRLIEQNHIEAVIMGCTELPLMYSYEKLPIPIFDTLKYHIRGIIDYMFKE